MSKYKESSVTATYGPFVNDFIMIIIHIFSYENKIKFNELVQLMQLQRYVDILDQSCV